MQITPPTPIYYFLLFSCKNPRLKKVKQLVTLKKRLCMNLAVASSRSGSELDDVQLWLEFLARAASSTAGTMTFCTGLKFQKIVCLFVWMFTQTRTRANTWF